MKTYRVTINGVSPLLQSRTDAEDGCPACCSDNIQPRGYYAAATGVYAQFQCQDCGVWSRAKKALKIEPYGVV